MSDSILICLLTAIVSVATGWSFAHSTVAVECNRLGSFYVGEKVFECKEKK